MNKNRLLTTIVLAACLSFFFVLFVNANIEISEDLTIVGNGTLDRDFQAQSASGFNGQKLTETILPVSVPRGNLSFSYHSNFELDLSNNSTIYYEAVSELYDSKHYVSNKNFKLGVSTGFFYQGAYQNKSFAFESSPLLSEALVFSEAEGRSVLRLRVVNQSWGHQRTVDMRTWLEGDYTIDWNFLVLNPEYPEAGEDDYLPCPWGPTFP